jgi:hypothetical protein
LIKMATKAPNTKEAVIQKTTTLRILAEQLAVAIKTDQNGTSCSLSDPLSPFRDASSVFKAQTTKLGLLLVNKPLTPSAIYKILDDLEKRVLPALYGSASYIALHKELFGSIFVGEVARALQEALGSMKGLTEAVEKVFDTPNKIDHEHVMFAVGIVYSACDAIMELIDKGVPGVLFKKMKEWTALMEDALAELREWREDVDEDVGEDGDSVDEDATSEAERSKTLEELAGSLSIGEVSKRLPGHRNDLVDLVDEALRRLDLVIKLCQATSKRRVRKFPVQPTEVASQDFEGKRVKDMLTLNGVVLSTEQMQSDLDELAAAFYDFDVPLIHTYVAKLSQDAENIAQCISQNWDGQSDDFTTWTQTWKKLINKHTLPTEMPIS